MQIRFLQPAQYELDEAIAYYNAQASNLGQVFLVEVLASLNRVCQYLMPGILYLIKQDVAN